MSRRSRLRLFILQALVVSLFATLFGRLWYLQVASGTKYTQAATSNRQRPIVTPATRGQILDDRGQPLVRNGSALVVTVDRPVVRKLPDNGKAVLTRLAGVLGMPYAELDQRIQLCDARHGPPCWNGSPYQPIPVKEKDVTPQMALAIDEHREDFPGVATAVQAIREYPQPAGASAAHVLGHLGPITQAELDKSARADAQGTDLVGRGGIEQQYDHLLRGTDGVKTVAVDRLGTVTGTISQTPATSGDSLVLSLDSGIQAVAEQALDKAVQRARKQRDTTTGINRGGNYRAPFGAAVVLDAQTGRVVALASYPSYNPAVWLGGISTQQFDLLKQNNALLNQATQEVYAPGSTFKLVSAADALHAGHPSGDRYACPSSIRYKGQLFRNFESESFRSLTLQEALQVSCDTVFYPFGLDEWTQDQARLSAGQPALEPEAHMASAFGYGTRTGIDIPGEASGYIPTRAGKRKIWEETKADACAGAKRRPPDDPFQRLDEDNCKHGYVYLPGDAAQLEIGQGGMAATPLQLATAYAAIANGGTVYSPQVGKAVVDAAGHVVRQITPATRGKLPISGPAIGYLQDALATVTQRTGGLTGTATGVFTDIPVPVAGKTGTAEVTNKQPTSWFASFAPVHPAPGQRQYAVVVMVAEAGQGALVAAPAVADIYRGIYGVRRPPAACAGQPPDGLPALHPDGTTTPPPCAAGPSVAPAAPPPTGSAKSAAGSGR